MVLLIALLMFIGQSNLMMQQLQLQREARSAAADETRYNLVSFLDSTIGQEMTLRNSRYSINNQLKQCLTGTPTPCDERVMYDMILASPTPPVVFQGGTWPEMAAGVPMLAGGLKTNKLFYTPTGAHCPDPTATEATSACPLQAIIQFRPLCGGNINAPDFKIVGGALCAGPATGFDVIVGVGKLLGSNVVYHQKTTSGGDAKIYRFSALIMKN
jgi:hypothetical protein